MIFEGKEIKASVIGAGKLGTSLTLALHGNNILSEVIVRSDESVHRLINKQIPADKIMQNLSAISKYSDIIFICVGDNEIPDLCDTLYANKIITSDQLIVHCSGILGFEPFKSLINSGKKVGIAHPFQTFYYPAADLFKGIFWAIDCDEKDRLIEKIIITLGGKSANVNFRDEKIRSLYHSSAVVASNYMNLLINLGSSLAEKAGIDAYDFLAPIIKTTIDNNIKALESKSEPPLTGPIAREDINAIRSHFSAMAEFQDLQEAYKNISLASATLALEKGIIKNKFYVDLINLFTKNEAK